MRAPASPDDFHVVVPRGVRLEVVFRLEHRRTVSNDWFVRHDGRCSPRARQSHPFHSSTGSLLVKDGDISSR